MFDQTYEGNAVKSFIRGLDVYSKIYKQDRHYGRSIALLQSSGTGKSRLVHELGKRVCASPAFYRRSKLIDQFTVDSNPQCLLSKT